MPDPVYPNNGITTNAQSCAFFSALPRAVGDLRAQGVLKPRDVDVLRELLDHKNRRTSQVDPLQRTLAARMGCSLDTIQRSLARLVQAGLIAKIRMRDACGRLGQCVYDLAQTLALMPHQAAKMRSGQWGASDTSPSPAPDRKAAPAGVITKPQKCGFNKADSLDVVQADNIAPAPPQGPPSPAAVALIAQGVFPRIAAGLVERFGEARCRQALTALGQRRTVHDKPAWVVGCLLQGWTVAASATARPQSQHPYAPPSAPPGPPIDALDALDVAAYAALEATAHALLWDETKPAWRSTLLSGRNPAYLRNRMRALLSAQTS